MRSACTSRSQPLIGDGWLCVGDAAMSVDPLYSDGLGKAIRAAPVVADAVVAELRGQNDGIEEYQRRMDRLFADYVGTTTGVPHARTPLAGLDVLASPS